MSEVAIASLFYVTVDAMDIGTWTECSGLSAKYDVDDYEEGGQNRFVHKLPGRLKYTNAKLKRAVDADSAKVARWFSSLAKTGARSTASITAYDGDLEVMATWGLVDVIPVSWSGPSFSVDGGKVGIEELELAHHGFM
jgi:phage tail-like protein